jgi:hypothetical protein
MVFMLFCISILLTFNSFCVHGRSALLMSFCLLSVSLNLPPQSTDLYLGGAWFKFKLGHLLY